MQIPFMQAKQFNQMNNPFVGSAYKADAGVSLRTRRQMMKAEDNAKEAEAVRVTISAEAMELSRKAKELDRECRGGYRRRSRHRADRRGAV